MSSNTFTKPEIDLLVFTDLDATLLDHEDYQFEEALPAIRLLQAKHIPIIPATSKTVEELIIINQALNNHHPFIAENGCIICLPNGYFENQPSADEYRSYQLVKLTLGYSEVLKALLSLRETESCNFVGFNDMNVAAIAKETGLTIEQAKNAKKRVCSEPIIWLGSEDELIKFKALLEKIGLQAIKGGRFWHVLGKVNKAMAMQRLISLYQSNGFKAHTIALGDSPNDIDMLNEADTAIVIMRKDGTRLDYESNKKVIYSSEPAPVGWNASILQALSEFTTKSD